MKIESKEFKNIPIKIGNIIVKYKLEVFIIFVSIIFGFLILRIGQYSISEPTKTAIDEKEKSANFPKIDQQAVDNIEKLEDQNIEVKSIFEESRKNRNNPFCENQTNESGQVISDCNN
jgi:hypothetical protein